MNDEELQQVLGELRDEPVPFASVRQRVLAEAAHGRRRHAVPLWAWSLAAAATLIIVTLAGRPALREEALALPAPPRLLVQTPVFEVARTASPLHPVRRIELVKEAFTVKMLTDDPDVVIYWIVGSEGDSL